MGTATPHFATSIMASGIAQQQESTLVSVCRKIVNSVASDHPMKGDLVEIPQFTEKVLRSIASSRATKDDRVRNVAQGIVLGNILGIEDLNLRAPSSDGMSDEEFVEGIWNSACGVLSAAITSAADPAFLTRVRNEITQFVSAVQCNTITLDSVLAGTDSFDTLAFDEGYKEAHGTRHLRDAFRQRFVQSTDSVATEGRSSAVFLQPELGTPRHHEPDRATPSHARAHPVVDRDLSRSRPFTPRAPPIHPEYGVNKRAALTTLIGRANTNSNAAFTNGYLLWIKIRTVVHRRISTRKQEMIEALNTICSAGFYKRFRWDDWVLCVSSMLNSLAALGWGGVEAHLVEGLAVSIGDDVINVQMRDNLSRITIDTFLGLVMWIDTERERMRLGPIAEPVHPVVTSAAGNLTSTGHNYAAVAQAPPTSPNPALVKNVMRKRFECFNCGSPDHKVSECPTPAAACPSCGGKGHAHKCPGRYNQATRRFVQPAADPRMDSIRDGLRNSPNLMAAVEKLISANKTPTAMLAEILPPTDIPSLESPVSPCGAHHDEPWHLVGKRGKIIRKSGLPILWSSPKSPRLINSTAQAEMGVVAVSAGINCNTYASVATSGTRKPASPMTVRHDSCASRTYIAPNSPYFLHGYTGTTTSDIRLASGQTSVQVRIGDGTISVIAADGGFVDICIPGAWEVPTFTHTLLSQRELYNLYGTQTSDLPGDMMTLTFPDGRSTTLDVVAGVYQYRIPHMPPPVNTADPSEDSVPAIVDTLMSLMPAIKPPPDQAAVATAAPGSPSPPLAPTNVTSPSPALVYWHHALGHVSYSAAIDFMMAHNIPVRDSDHHFIRERIRCSDCAPFKATKISIAKNAISPPVTPGHTVYADQMSFPGKFGDSVRGQYTTSIIFTDKATRFTRLYPMKTSAKAAEAYRHFLGLLVQSPGYREHCRLHTDHGSEFVNKHVRKAAADLGARITNTGAECHERIGTVERRVRTIKESVGAALCGARLSRHFYAYVAMEVVRRRNHLPSQASTSQNPVTPFSLLAGQPPETFTMAEFPIIGARCTAWHVRADKYANRSELGIYLGHDEESSGAIVYFPRTNGMTSTVHYTIDDSTCINEYVQVEVPGSDIDY